MSDIIEINHAPIDNSFKKYIPILTAICCLTSIVLFIGINLEEQNDNWEVYKKWGSPNVTDIFNGSYWGLITSNFLHTEIWHIAFNLYWVWFFGKKIEFESKKIFYGILILSSALVSSLSEVSFTSTTAIGLSGIGYSLFGFILVKSKTTKQYKDYLDKKITGLFIFWLLLCLILTYVKAWNVGNAAHIGGFLWGMTLAYISKYDNYKQSAVGVLLLSILISSIFWNPFSTLWLSYQAFDLHQNQKVEEAIIIYKKILSRDQSNEFAKTNLRQLEVYKLQEKAVKLYKNQKYNEVKKVYNQILIIDKDNQWAKNNLKSLSTE
ncbi:rhomboid family intramembrane serine protease [Runella sp. SP2]|uniref:rhomboid family intramembrane serine protease n=1 Tax=Runella sp. SP2 TaxID=2268026 RepID=UPI000F0903C0|nr:rhomboid family intramembrane serine protease [Runella sp. SP2]AYQ32048.1 rhomboid family intramembrane serine protease [Runella sp. SP2]